MAIEEKDVIINGKVNGARQIQYPATRWRNIIDPEQIFKEPYPYEKIYGRQLYATDATVQNKLRTPNSYMVSASVSEEQRTTIISFTSPEFKGVLDGKPVDVPQISIEFRDASEGDYYCFYLIYNDDTNAWSVKFRTGHYYESYLSVPDLGPGERLAGYFGHAEYESESYIYFYPSDIIYVSGDLDEFGIINAASFPVIETADLSNGALEDYLKCTAELKTIIDALPDGILSLNVESLVLESDAIADDVFKELRPKTAAVYVVEHKFSSTYSERYLLLCVCNIENGGNERYRQIKVTGSSIATRFLDTYEGGWSSWKAMNTTNYDLDLTINGIKKAFNGSQSVSANLFAPTTVGTSGYLLESSGSGSPRWVQIKRPRTAAFVIAAADSGIGKDEADYVCDGTADQAEINNAIAALPESGSIQLSKGHFNLTGPVLVNKAGVTISGSGTGTVIVRKYTGNTSGGTCGLISVGADHCTVRDLSIEGNSSSYSDTYHSNAGICVAQNIRGTTITNILAQKCDKGIYLIHTFHAMVVHNTCTANRYGIKTYTGWSSSTPSGKENFICNNICNDNTTSGIYMGSNSYCVISGNVCNNNTTHGIYCSGGSNNNFSNNICCTNGSAGIQLYGNNGAVSTVVVAGNLCYTSSDTGHAMYFEIAQYCMVYGNRCYSKGGYALRMYKTQYSTITGNYCSSNLACIEVSGDYNAISGNVCGGGTGIHLSASGTAADMNTVTGNVVINAVTGIQVAANAAKNTISGNTCLRSSYTAEHHTILLESGAANNLIAGNNISGLNYTDNSGNATNTFVNNKV